MKAILFIILLFQIDLCRSKDSQRILSRQKRYLVFPEGASFSVSMSDMWNVYLHVDRLRNCKGSF